MAEKYLRLRRGPNATIPTLNRGELSMILDRMRLVYSVDGVNNRLLGEVLPYEAGRLYKTGDLIYRASKFYEVTGDFTASTWNTDAANTTLAHKIGNRVVANIAARNAITGGDLYEGLLCYVIDATGDLTVASGAALYVYGTQWNKIAEYESMDSVISTASETTAGIAEIATSGEVAAGTADDKIVTPKKVAENTAGVLADGTMLEAFNSSGSLYKLRIKALGVGSAELAAGAVTSGKLAWAYLNRTATATSMTTNKQKLIGVTDTSAPRTITLATADLADGAAIIIKDESGAAGTNNITITPQSGTIDGAASITITVNYGVARVYSNGTNWFTW